MTTEPPFAPPYKLAIDTPAGRRWVEVLADGSQVEAAPPATTLAPSASASSASSASSAAPRSGGGKAQAFLNVPYAEKDEAKQLGARWDPARKKWYVPHGVDLEPFSRWTAP